PSGRANETSWLRDTPCPEGKGLSRSVLYVPSGEEFVRGGELTRMSKVVGIDLGTTNSLVAYVKDGVPFVIRDESGDALVPSVVSVGADNTIVVGREAQQRLLTDAKRTAYSVKRFMGKGREDVQHEAEHFPFRVSGEA